MRTAAAERIADVATGTARDAVERMLLDGPRSVRRLNITSHALPPVLRPGAARSILDITEFFGETSGGVRTYLLEKARYVEARPELRHVVVVPGARDAISETRGVRCYRLRGPHIPTQAPYRFMLATRSSRRIIAHERPDVIEVGSVGLVPWVVRRATQCADRPLVAFYHSHLPRLIAPFAERAGAARLAASSLAWQYLRTLDRFFATTIVASRFVARELAAAGLDRTAYVPLGVDLERFHPARREHAGRTRQWFGLSDRPLIVYAGRLAREKQVDVLLAAWRMAQRTVDAELVLVGAGPTGPELRARAHGLRVRWIPHVSSRTMLADLIAAASLVVAPSPVETFGLAAVEAMASGVPVLGADRGGVAELVERSGAGTTFPAGDAGALAVALRAAWGSDLGAAGARGRAYVEREHAWSTVFNRLFAVYDGVVGA